MPGHPGFPGGEIVGGEPAAGTGVPAGIEGSLAAGARVGGYRLERPLGQGGMAVVYLARDERLDRLVALKVLAPALATDEGFRARFIRESRAAAAVDDPHVIPVFEAGDAGGMLYIAMRYVPGGDVGTIVRREGPLSPGRAAAVIAQVASALDAAHAAGLVHRDVKPANMLADVRPGRAEHVYLADFGLTKKTLAASAGLTGTAQFLGTLDYVAPEQIQGRPADGRTDQYGLACAAFELLTGAPPFRREDAAAVMYAHLSDPPPPVTSRRADLPPGLDLVLARALAKAPADRYPSCQAFADALLQALGTAALRSRPPVSGEHESAPDHPPAQASPVSDRPPHAEAGPPTQDAGIPAPTAAAGTVASATQTAPAPADPDAGQIVPGQDATAPGRDNTTKAASRLLSRRRLLLATSATAAAAAAAGGITWALLPSQAAHQSTRLIATLTGHDAGVRAVVFSPDGQILATGSDDATAKLWRVASHQVLATLTGHAFGVDAVAFSPDGRILATGSYDATARLWDAASHQVLGVLHVPPSPDGKSNHVWAVAFSPDGRILATGSDDGTARLWDVASHQVLATLKGHTNPVAAVAFRPPDGRILATGGWDNTAIEWDVASRQRLATLGPYDYSFNGLAFSPDGRTLAAGCGDNQARLWNTASDRLVATLTGHTRGVNAVTFSPDGRILATGSDDATARLWDVASHRLLDTLTGHTRGVNAVTFSPDGRILATGSADRNVKLWRVDGLTN
jgi:eukaryotic-like serine/threonine-protein kinase